jgi:hypothetical protein
MFDNDLSDRDLRSIGRFYQLHVLGGSNAHIVVTRNLK